MKKDNILEWLKEGVGCLLTMLIFFGIPLFIMIKCDSEDKKAKPYPNLYISSEDTISSYSLFHVSSRCEKGLKQVKKLREAYNLGLSPSNFCGKCISEEQRDILLHNSEVFRKDYLESLEKEEHISRVYKAINNSFNVFDSEEEFASWLECADSLSVVLLYNLLKSRKSFYSAQDIDSFINYIGWEWPRLYELLPYYGFDNDDLYKYLQ